MKRLIVILATLLPLAGAAQQAPEAEAFVIVPVKELQLIVAAFELQQQRIEEQKREIDRLKEACGTGNRGL